MDINKTWDQVSEHLKETLGEPAFETWILPLRPRLKAVGDLVLEAPDTFFRDWVENHYKEQIKDALRDVLKQDPSFSFIVNPAAKNTPPVKPAASFAGRTFPVASSTKRHRPWLPLQLLFVSSKIVPSILSRTCRQLLFLLLFFVYHPFL